MGIFLGLAAVDAILYPYYNQQSKNHQIGLKLCTCTMVGEGDWIEQKYAEMNSFTFLVLRSQTLTKLEK